MKRVLVMVPFSIDEFFYRKRDTMQNEAKKNAHAIDGKQNETNYLLN
jgi:hypothetical protein